MSAGRHELTVEEIEHTGECFDWLDFWGECSCGWTCGPTTEADVVDSHREHVRHRALRDESVDLIVTSPPYFALRSYRDGDQHYDGQIGSEPTPQAFLEALWSVLAECWRVLKPSGSCWINLGDKRSGSGGHNNASISRWHTAPLVGNTPGATHLKKRADNVAEFRATRRNAPDRYNQAAFGRFHPRLPRHVRHVPLPGEWSKRGRCWNQSHLIELFFPGPHEKVQVKHLCDGCPVRPECREYALSNPSLQGYWGGMRHEERLRIIERKRRVKHGTRSTYTAGCHEARGA
jgi:hypothetical protein